MVDPRTPVIVGAGQLSHRKGEDGEPTALSLMAEATRRAAADAGPAGDALLQRAHTVAATETFSWPVHDPAARLAAELALSPAQTIVSARGGTSPVELLGDLCARIAGGELDVAVLAGGEAFSALKRAQADGTYGEVGDNPPPSRVVGSDREPSHPGETAAALLVPVVYYPLFEHALRAAKGRGLDEHVDWIASWWARYSDVAAGHEHAWSREPMDAAAVAAPSPANRMVTDPYRKVMNANIAVDQGAALLLCSAEAAQAAGVPRDRWVFVHATGYAHDHWFAGQRPALDRSPAIAANAGAALDYAGVGIDDIAHLDLYSCFPSAVQVAAGELGVDPADPGRVPTVTGGLSFFGGPASNYVTHALATQVQRLREDGDGLAMATGVGWYLTKHGTAILGSQPPARAFRNGNPQAAVDAQPAVAIEEGFAGSAPVETYTATFDHTGAATLAIVAVRTPSGGRSFAHSADPACVAALLDGDPLGRRVRVDGAALLA